MRSSHHATRLAILGAACALISCSTPAKDDPGKVTDKDISAPPDAPGIDPRAATPPPPATLADVEPVRYDRAPELPLGLREGKERQDLGGASAGQASPKATALGASEVQRVLSRMTPLPVKAQDTLPFAKREDSKPPPKTGDTVKTPFPPPEELKPPKNLEDEQAAQGPLKALRYSPEGDVPIAPKLSVTFNQPMVAVTSHDDTVKQGVPVTLEPQVKGKWRWVGAKTLLFEPDGEQGNDRFQMATEYTVSIKPDAKSTLGKTLEKPTTWTFRTPPPSVTQSYPQYGTFGLDQVMFLAFDQQIDPQAMLQHLQVKTGSLFGAAQLELAPSERVEADARVKSLAAAARPGTWLAFVAKGKLPYDSSIRVSVPKGAPSKEGPRTSDKEQGFSFQTYGPLKVRRAQCGWGDCRPDAGFHMELSNQLDAQTFSADQIKVEPPIPGMSAYVSGNWLYINGRKRGRTTYKITLDAGLTDEFKQTLGQPYQAEFKTTSDYPSLSSTSGPMVVLDPAGEPGYTVFSVNYDKLKVQAYQVQPSHWYDFLRFQRDYRYDGQQKSTPPGKLVWTKSVKVNGEVDDLVETTIGLKEALGKEGLGHLVLVIEPDGYMRGVTPPDHYRSYKPVIRTWAQSTKLALDGFVDGTTFLGWATSLQSGEPVEGVELSLGSFAANLKTDRQGMASIDLPSYDAKSHSKIADFVQGKKGADVAFLPENVNAYFYDSMSSSWHKRPGYDSLQWFVFDDRKMYRPDEEVHVKGWMRAVEHRKGGDIRLDPSITSLAYVVYDAQNNKLAEGESQVTSLGGFDFKLKLPKTPNLGQARITLSARGATANNTSHTHTFQIQEFRRPEFEVKAMAAPGPHLATQSTQVEVKASYFAGGALPNAQTTWSVTTSESSFTPPNQHRYSFGTWTPWWVTPSPSSGAKTETFQGKTDVTGIHHLALDVGKIEPPKPMTVRAQATVMDVNRQAWSSAANLLIHPSQHYVGLRSDTYFVEQGTPLKIQVIASDIEGNRLAQRPVKVRAHRTTWSYSQGQYKEELVEEQVCDLMTSGQDEDLCTFKTDIGGSYKISATTVDDYGRRNFTQITRWVSGGQIPKSRKVEQEQVQLIPDREDYAPGDTAQLLVQSPFVPAEGLLTLRRHGITEQRRFTMDKSTVTLSIPLKHGHMPNIYAQVDLVGSAKRLDAKGQESETLPRRPAYAKGSLNLKVSTAERQLGVTVTPQAKKLSPGAQTSVSVQVKDAQGKPVPQAEVALVVVDESILALSSYAMADPMALFYAMRSPDVRDYHLRAQIALVDPAALKTEEPPESVMLGGVAANGDEDSPRRERSSGIGTKSRAMAMPSAAPKPAMKMKKSMDKESMADSFGAAAEPEGAAGADGPIAVRQDFNPLAAFAPAVRTDAQGQGTITFKLPDNLTRYRVMAVAFEGKHRFGTGESDLTARLPLMVRPSAPRFLNFGDSFNLPVVLQNQTDSPMTVQLAARAHNVELTGAQGYAVVVPANDRVELQLPAVTAMAGTARFQVAAQAGQDADAAQFELPVWTPATSEAFATYGVVDQGAAVQAVKMPEKVWPQFGGLQVTTSSTAMQALTDAFLYLYSYPYECAEQLSSRMISVAALRDVLEAFKAEGFPGRPEVDAAMKRDIKKLLARQHYNGGFGLWRPNQEIWPFVSLHAIHALVRAKAKGYEVDAYAMQRATNYLRSIERHIPGYYHPYTRRFIIAYSLYVRSLMGDKDRAKAKQLLAQVGGKLEELPFESMGWLLGVFTGDANSQAELTQLRAFLNNRVTETAGAAHYAAAVSDGAHLIMHSDRRADAVILEALIDDQPKSDLIPKIVKGLMAHRKKGRWGNTQENASVLLALDKYFNTYEKQTPDFVARVWLGQQYAGQHAFKGRTTEEHQIDVPMSHLATLDGAQPLIIQKDGKGRMYYRVGMSYAPKSLTLESADHGFVVERAYEPVDRDSDVQRQADGTWVIRAGAKVKIKLTMVAPTRRYHVALVDPLPAGLEAENPALAVTGDIPQDPNANTGRGGRGGWWWWSRPWFEHQNMRDERVEAFTTLLWGGVHSYTYYARATTPGTFVVPPTKAEEMYSPETFGRSASDKVIVR